MPIAIVSPELTVTLIETRQKRATFLRHVISTLGLGNSTVAERRAETFEGEVDAVVARGVPQETVLAFAERRVRKGGCAVLMTKAGASLAFPTDLVEEARYAYRLPTGELHETILLRK